MRYFLKFLVLLLTTGLISSANASADYPGKPIKLIVGFPPGQMTDTLTRLLANHLSELLSQPIIVENRPGQGGSIGLAQLARAKPDGYEMALSPTAALVINPALYTSVGYKTLQDFEPVGEIAEVPFVLVANSSMPFSNLAGLIAYAKAHPGKVTFSSPGNGTLPHLGMVLLEQKAGISLTHIPYKGSPKAMIDLAAGRVSVGFDTEVVTKPLIEKKLLKILAVTSAKRLPAFPDVPTIIESGVPDFVLTAWFGLVFPKNTPPDIVKKINAELHKTLENAAFLKLLHSIGASAKPSSSADFAKLIKTESIKWSEIVRASNAKVD